MDATTARRGRGSGVWERLYRVLMRRNSVYVTFVVAGAFVGERIVDYGVHRLWDYNNEGNAARALKPALSSSSTAAMPGTLVPPLSMITSAAPKISQSSDSFNECSFSQLPSLGCMPYAMPIATVLSTNLLQIYTSGNNIRKNFSSSMLEGLEIPYTFHFGACSACAGFMVSGSIDQSNGSFPDGTQTAKEHVLTCFSYPTSDRHSHSQENGAPLITLHVPMAFGMTALSNSRMFILEEY
ncbi:cytochrome b-c1 complex subunit [Musa troglodytarum]|uniref:Complex III subunit 9 n=1 Tax=Musa troglodytarum TaxID=320322 RepID=A0A9E7I250_9LILI|nr:cytochrome b-c1 complex subunit [Musa troglodytarum]